MIYTVNTSNTIKIEDFKKFLGDQVIFSHHDLREPLADPLTIIRYKASQFKATIIDDTSLEIEGLNVGVEIRWLLAKLPEYIGRKAVFISYLGLLMDSQVHIYKGEVAGRIMSPKGRDLGFLAYFRPDGTALSLGEEKPDQFNARYFALKNLLAKNPYKIEDPLFHWDGPFQS